MSEIEKHFLTHPNRRQTLGLMALGASSVMFSGLTGQSPAFAAEPKSIKGQLTISFSQEPTVFNPHMPHIEVDDGIHFSLYDPLFSVDAEGKFVPALPSKFQRSKTVAFPPTACNGRSSSARASNGTTESRSPPRTSRRHSNFWSIRISAVGARPATS